MFACEGCGGLSIKNALAEKRAALVAAPDILYFLGYGVAEALPGHSTLSRTRQLYGAPVCEHLFD